MKHRQARTVADLLRDKARTADVVGTGGDSQFPLSHAADVTNLETADAATFGVLKLTLQPDRYTWSFVPEQGNGNGTYTDAGSTTCHGAPPRS